MLPNANEIGAVVDDVLQRTPVLDMHTHLFAPGLKGLMLWGIDDLLTYHYLEAELFRASEVTPAAYFALSKTEKADLIWRTLFVERAPVSESTRGVVAVLHALGLDTQVRGLGPIREYFLRMTVEEHTSKVLDLAGVAEVVMTNDSLD